MSDQSGKGSIFLSTMENFMERCGFLPSITTKTTRPDGSVVTVKTQSVRTLNQRKLIPVQHAIETHPFFSLGTVSIFAAQAQVPLAELQYWLGWSNKLRVNGEERGFDLPPAKAVLEFLRVTLQQYQKPTDSVTYSPAVTGIIINIPTIPLADLEAFIQKYERLEVPNRETLIPALDELVGKYL